MYIKLRHIIPVLFLVFLVSIPFGVRTTIISHSVNGEPNAFLSFFLYHLDILALIIGILGILFHVKHGAYTPSSGARWVGGLFGGLIIWSFLALFASPFPDLAFLSTVRLLLGGVLVGVLPAVLTDYWSSSIKTLLLSGGVISLAALTQVILQSDLGVSLFSEATIGTDIAGTAEVTVFNTTLVRGYGFFPHPNILGFFVFAGAASLFLHQVSALPAGVSRETFRRVGAGIIVISCVALGAVDHYILTSAQAFYTLVALLVLLITPKPHTIAPMSPPVFWSAVAVPTIGAVVAFSHAVLPVFGLMAVLTLSARFGVFHVKHRRKITRATMAGVAGLLLILGPAAIPWSGPANEKRLIYLERGFNIVAEHPLWGTGLHQYVTALPGSLPAWQYEPVHNAFALITAEIGLIGGMLALGTTVIGGFYVIHRV